MLQINRTMICYLFKHMPNHKRIRCFSFVFGIGCVVLTTVLIWGLVKTKGGVPTVSNAGRVIWTNPPGVEILSYDWLNQTQFIYLAESKDMFSISLFDVQTRKDSIICKATEYLNQLGSNVQEQYHLEISPDHKWLLIEQGEGKSALVFSLDKTKPSIVKTPISAKDGPICWYDETGLAQFVRKGTKSEAHFYQIDGETVSWKTIEISVPIAYPMAFRRDESCFVWPIKRNSRLEIIRLWLGSPLTIMTNSVMHLSDHGFQESPVFSPNGKNLAWLQASQSQDTLHFKPWFPFLSRNHEWVQTIYVADLTKKTVRRLAISEEKSRITSIMWIPDGSISVLLDRKLYLLPNRKIKN